MHPHARPGSEDAVTDPRENLQSYYYALLKRRWIVLAVALSTWTTASITTFLQPRRYDASALIQIDWGKINLVQDVVIDDQGEGSGNLFATQEKILRSRVLARRVTEELRLWEHPVFRSLLPELTGQDEEIAVKATSQKVLSMLRVAHFRNTQLMEVAFVTPDPTLSARLADAHVRQYVLFNSEAESDLARGASSFIQEEIEQLRREIARQESLLKNLNPTGEPAAAESRDHDIVFQSLEDLNRALTQAKAERASAEARYRSLSKARPASLPEVREASAVRELKTNHSSLKAEHSRLRARFGRDWPEVARSQSALDEAARELEEEMASEARKVVAAARIAYEELAERERLLASSMEAQRDRVQEIQRVRSSYSQIKAELDNNREVLRGLLRRRSESDLSADLGERQPVKVRVVEPAEAPERPSSPNVPMNLAVGLILGLLLGGGVAFALDYFDSTISTVEDLRRYIALPYLGMVPSYPTDPVPDSGRRALGAGGAESRTGVALIDRGPSAAAESQKVFEERLRFLRGSLLLSTPGKAPKAVLVTSPDQSCGKTFVSFYLSAALVQLNKTVLLVDSDLRNPNLHKVFRYRNRLGLTNVLTGQRPLHEGCIMRTHVPNLFLLMAGPKCPSPGELLASEAMVEVLRSSARHFDFVVLDSAPLLPVFDSHSLSTFVDAVILVARSGMTTRHAVKTSAELLERVNGKVTGLVLNDVDLSDYAQYYYHSAYTYEYGRYAGSGANGSA